MMLKEVNSPYPPAMNFWSWNKEAPKNKPESVDSWRDYSRDLDVWSDSHRNDSPGGEKEQVQEHKKQVPEEFACSQQSSQPIVQ